MANDELTRSSKLGRIVRGKPNFSVKNSCVADLHMLTHLQGDTELSGTQQQMGSASWDLAGFASFGPRNAVDADRLPECGPPI